MAEGGEETRIGHLRTEGDIAGLFVSLHTVHANRLLFAIQYRKLFLIRPMSTGIASIA